MHRSRELHHSKSFFIKFDDNFVNYSFLRLYLAQMNHIDNRFCLKVYYQVSIVIRHIPLGHNIQGAYYHQFNTSESFKGIFEYLHLRDFNNCSPPYVLIIYN